MTDKKIYRILTKDDGLWLELNSPTSGKSACINIHSDVPLIKQVIHEVWTAIRGYANQSKEKVLDHHDFQTDVEERLTALEKRVEILVDGVSQHAKLGES